MVRVGGRTAHRMATEIFNTSAVQKPSGRAPVKGKLCDAICEVFCSERICLLWNLTSAKPDPTKISEEITDFRTISDLLDGGACSCECESAETLVPDIMAKKYDLKCK